MHLIMRIYLLIFVVNLSNDQVIGIQTPRDLKPWSQVFKSFLSYEFDCRSEALCVDDEHCGPSGVCNFSLDNRINIG